jgi:phosphoribosylaminoimidazole-succinocarboxamide synthase
MTPEIVDGISERYIELFENITGEGFKKANVENVTARIEKNISEFLRSN